MAVYLPATISAGRRNNEQLTLKDAETFKVGAFVLLDTGSVVAECGADPASIYGIALDAAGKNPDPTKVIVCKATEEVRAWLVMSRAPIYTDVGVSYGITKDGTTGIWYVDAAKTGGSARVYVHRIDVDTGRVEVSVLAANRQVAP